MTDTVLTRVWAAETETCLLCFRISRIATEWWCFCVTILSQHCIFSSEKNHKKHLLFLFFFWIWDVMMLLIIVSFTSQSAVTDDFYSQKSRAILIILLQWKIEEERRKKTMRKKYLFECFTDNFFLFSEWKQHSVISELHLTYIHYIYDSSMNCSH